MFPVLNLKKDVTNGTLFDPIRYDQDQTNIESIINKFRSLTVGDSGADNVAIAPIAGLGDVNTDTVYEMIVALKAYAEAAFISTSGGYTKPQVDAALQSLSIGQTPLYKTFVQDASLDGDVYTYGGLKREDNTLAVDFTLSNKVGGSYLTKTYHFYDITGLIVLKTTVRTLTYKPNGTVVEV